ncbi:uncharacterized protein A1O9_12608 [Exophiala aquamarina CBS 119918]|uniref:ASX DEUBAD domain-containing protein n=1 Tax=Exophiala aquamarina CBS 119918 TaxID=1182545 RepID=A0A072NW81_9EURO|nr:uncharacterized protein A1O9_12608 [Exophiala aquamarina CBS 119918]KEF51258.1 hypothetical protein A1O9_12608 [Exophiala aquamarina CBS 119918]
MPAAKKKPKGTTGPWSSSRILNSTSPVASMDIHTFLVNCISAWDEKYDEAQKRAIIDSLPRPYRKYEFDGSGHLICPVSTGFLLEDPYFKSAIQKFKTNLIDGLYEKGWQNQARTAMQERSEGKFDTYLREKAECEFGSCMGAQQRDDAAVDSHQINPESSDSDGESRLASDLIDQIMTSHVPPAWTSDLPVPHDGPWPLSVNPRHPNLDEDTGAFGQITCSHKNSASRSVSKHEEIIKSCRTARDVSLPSEIAGLEDSAVS